MHRAANSSSYHATESLIRLFKTFPADEGIGSMLIHIFHIISSLWHYPLFTVDKGRIVAISNIFIALILFYFGIKFSKYISAIIRRRLVTLFNPESTVDVAVEKISYYVLLVISSFLALQISNIPITAFTFIGGALAIGLGFGSQNVLNNFISGLIIMLEQPIRMGDVIECDKFVGRIVNIGARCTHIITTDNIDIMVPNSTLLQSTIINLTLSQGARVRKTLEMTTNIDNNLALFKQVILNFVSKHPAVIKTPLPEMFLISIRDNKAYFKVQYWIDIMGNIGNNSLLNDIHYHIYEKSKDGMFKLENKYII